MARLGKRCFLWKNRCNIRGWDLTYGRWSKKYWALKKKLDFWEDKRTCTWFACCCHLFGMVQWPQHRLIKTGSKSRKVPLNQLAVNMDYHNLILWSQPDDLCWLTHSKKWCSPHGVLAQPQAACRYMGIEIQHASIGYIFAIFIANFSPNSKLTVGFTLRNKKGVHTLAPAQLGVPWAWRGRGQPQRIYRWMLEKESDDFLIVSS